MYLELFFWLCVVVVGYAYFGYPLLLIFLGRNEDLPHLSPKAADDWASMTVIIAARNEAHRLAAKLEDVLAQGYPPDRLQVLVVSDGSTDGTAEMARGFAERGVESIALKERGGKEAAQARGIAAARGQILVFTDVATRIGGAGLRGIAQALQQEGAGAVSSEDRFLAADGRPGGEGLYVSYEMWLRRLESRARGLVGLSGSLFAVRQELCDEWPVDVPSDLVVAFRCMRRGMKAISVPAVQGVYPDLQQNGAEFARKRRTALRGMAGVASAPAVLNVFQFGLFSLQVWSHKILRWVVPWLLLSAFAANLLLLETRPVYHWTLMLQGAGYALAAAGLAFPVLRATSLVRIAYYFALSNAALAMAAIDYFRGRRVVFWEPSVR